MEINLESMTLDSLQQLRRKVVEAIENYEDRRKRDALAAAESAARERGFTLVELMEGASAKKIKRGKGEAKYVHPSNPRLTWSGRGRQPAWIKALEASGHSRKEFSI